MLEIFKARKEISEAYEISGEWEVWIGYQPVKIKVVKNIGGKYFYNTSHYYHGSEQAGPYISSINGFDTKEEAVRGAIKQITGFYDEEDENAVWKVNDNY